MSTATDLASPRTRRDEHRHIPGEAGLWVFIFGDLAVFAAFFCTYLSYRAQDTALFNASQLTLSQTYGAINTLLLLTSSLFVALGVKAVRRNAGSIAPRLFASGLACGLGFVGMKFLEYGEKLANGVTPATNEFFLYYFILTGLHFFHVVLGTGVLVALIVKSSTRQGDDGRFRFIEGGACLWHLVDLLWIILFPLLYFVR